MADRLQDDVVLVEACAVAAADVSYQESGHFVGLPLEQRRAWKNIILAVLALVEERVVGPMRDRAERAEAKVARLIVAGDKVLDCALLTTPEVEGAWDIAKRDEPPPAAGEQP